MSHFLERYGKIKKKLNEIGGSDLRKVGNKGKKCINSVKL